MVAADPWAMDILRIARRLALPDWAIGAGFLRGMVWDRLCGFASRTALNDIDVVYFDTTDTGRDRENAAEAQLHAWRPDQVWSVRNMARMHLRNGDASYRDTEDAISHWLETPTAVAVSLDADDSLRLLAPHGADDLLAAHVRPTPQGRRKIDQYQLRVTTKNWPARWPCVKVEAPT
ncbi:MAG TPA: nucleotidyltransferase family protein [Ferrovibrio sp.]|uniref:nucleotidyltransferase family protein n=1 Tax=Ferrovibrio sp. TaxID=1917215 RepID=UPI002B4B20D4|nr:nucleotidyltransferase family protein [Ferrovibrio sp.]HLT78494.1 nucleotidyltransferase family protein [Ferrovibrio sp.]